MTTVLTDSFYTNLKNELNLKFADTEVLIQFFTGIVPTLDEEIVFLNGNREDDKLGEVSVTLLNGELSSDEPITFTPSKNGTCIWGTIAPIDSLDEIIIIENILDQVIIEDINFDTTVENNVQKILIKI